MANIARAIRQYIDTLIEYHSMILCYMNINIVYKYLLALSGTCGIEMKNCIHTWLVSRVLGCNNISNIVIYQFIDIKTVYLYIQYFMIDAVVVYYGCQFYSSATI